MRNALITSAKTLALCFYLGAIGSFISIWGN